MEEFSLNGSLFTSFYDEKEEKKAIINNNHFYHKRKYKGGDVGFIKTWNSATGQILVMLLQTHYFPNDIAFMISGYIEVFFDTLLANKVVKLARYFDIRFPYLASNEQTQGWLNHYFHSNRKAKSSINSVFPYNSLWCIDDDPYMDEIKFYLVANKESCNIDIDSLQDIMMKYPITELGQWKEIEVLYILESENQFTYYTDEKNKKKEMNFPKLSYNKTETVYLPLTTESNHNYLTIWDIYHCASVIVNQNNPAINPNYTFRIDKIEPISWYYKNGDPILKVEIILDF